MCLSCVSLFQLILNSQFSPEEFVEVLTLILQEDNVEVKLKNTESVKVAEIVTDVEVEVDTITYFITVKIAKFYSK